MQNALNIAQLLASRLNHDYVAPLTAVSNSCELAKISPNDRDECMGLISQSVSGSIDQLKFYRLAFGTYIENEELSADMLKQAIIPIMQTNDIVVEFNLPSEMMLKSDGKLIALCFMCIQSSFAKLLRFNVDFSGSTCRFEAAGDAFADQDKHNRILRFWEGQEPPTSSEIQYPIFLMLIEALGRELSYVFEDGTIKVDVTAHS